jgi:hypothetical protein
MPEEISNENQKYIVRTDRAGVFYARIAERRGNEIDLLDARRIHYWARATECIGIALNGVGGDSRITAPIASMTVLGVIEILPVSPKAEEVLSAWPVWKA